MFVQENSIAACLDYMKDRLAGRFSDSEIRLIQSVAFEKRLGLSRSDLMLRKSDGLSESDLLYFRSIVKRLLANEPLQYVMGETEFYGLVLKTDTRALIPRPETEELVYQVKEWADARSLSGTRILDLCTGSGCIALGLKSIFPNAKVTGVDLSHDALSLATENAQNLGLPVDFYSGDVLSGELEASYADASWDVIVSNPPYIPYADKSLMEANVLEFEPHMALFVEDTNPLIFYRKIAELARKKLVSAGLLAVEIHENLAEETVKLFGEIGFIHVRVLTDLQGRNRMVFAENP
jgi:release factor glutamine methyltransferase